MTSAYLHRPMQAFLLAVAAEIALLAVGAVVLSSATSTPALSTPVPITLVTEETPPAPLEPPAPPKPLPVPVPFKPKVAPAKPPAPAPPKAQVSPPEPPTPQAVTPTETPNAFTEPVSPPSPPPPPVPPVSAAADPSPEYAAKVRAAVLAAVYYPPAAAALHYTGRVRVEFHLRDGVPGAARVLTGSGIGMIDRAALQSVQNAHYPEPPEELHGSDRLYQVWVEFSSH